MERLIIIEAGSHAGLYWILLIIIIIGSQIFLMKTLKKQNI